MNRSRALIAICVATFVAVIAFCFLIWASPRVSPEYALSNHKEWMQTLEDGGSVSFVRDDANRSEIKQVRGTGRLGDSQEKLLLKEIVGVADSYRRSADKQRSKLAGDYSFESLVKEYNSMCSAARYDAAIDLVRQGKYVTNITANVPEVPDHDWVKLGKYRNMQGDLVTVTVYVSRQTPGYRERYQKAIESYDALMADIVGRFNNLSYDDRVRRFAEHDEAAEKIKEINKDPKLRATEKTKRRKEFEAKLIDGRVTRNRRRFELAK